MSSRFGGLCRSPGRFGFWCVDRTWSVPLVAARCPISSRRDAARDDSRRRAADRARARARGARRRGRPPGRRRRRGRRGRGGRRAGQDGPARATAMTAADAGLPRAPRGAGPARAPLPLGVVRALLEAPLREAPRGAAQLLDGAAAPAGELLLDGTVPGGDATMLVAHSCSGCARPRRGAAARARRRRRAVGRPLVARGAHLLRAAGSPTCRCCSSSRARRRPRRAGRPAQHARRRRGGDRAAPAAADAAGAAQLMRRLAPDTPGGRLPRLPPRSAATRGCWASSAARSPRTARRPSTRPSGDAPPVTAIARSVVRRRLADAVSA